MAMMMSSSASRTAADNDDNYMGEKLSAPPDFNGPTSRRHFTDILCTLLLWAMWISMTGLGIYAMQRGDYRLILYPLDYAGNRKWLVCVRYHYFKREYWLVHSILDVMKFHSILKHYRIHLTPVYWFCQHHLPPKILQQHHA
jgi:hypothetical protein